MRRPRNLFFLICLAAMCAAAPGRAAAKEYSIALWPVMGSMSKSYNDLMSKIIHLIFSKMGEKVKIVEMDSAGKAYDALKTGKVDATVMLNSDYALLVAGGWKKITPVISYSMKGHKNEYKCILVRKNSPYKTAADLKGKPVYSLWNEIEYVSLRKYLTEKKIDMPLDKFFGGFVGGGDDTDGVPAVAEGKAEAVLVHYGTIGFYRFANSTIINKLKQLDCFEMPSPGTSIAWADKLGPELQKNLFDTMVKMDTYPEFKNYKRMLDLMQEQLILVSAKDFEGIIRLMDESRKKKWDVEYRNLKK